MGRASSTSCSAANCSRGLDFHPETLVGVGDLNEKRRAARLDVDQPKGVRLGNAEEEREVRLWDCEELGVVVVDRLLDWTLEEEESLAHVGHRAEALEQALAIFPEEAFLWRFWQQVGQLV